MSIPKNQKVNKERPCPACGHTDWCFFLKDGTAVWCGRASTMTGSSGATIKGKPREGGGWVHRVSGTVAAGRADRGVGQTRREINWEKYVTRWRRAILQKTVDALAQQLGVSTESLERLGIGFASRAALKILHTKCSDGGAFSFPMVNGRGRVVGIRLRTPGGFKFAVDGSDGSGLFVPAGIHMGCDLVAAEGPTSTAALLTAGVAAVGRPNCRAGALYLKALCERLEPRLLVILGDNDKADGNGRRAGQESASELCVQLKDAATKVRSALPPRQFKDARVWLKHGGNSQAMARWLGVNVVNELSTGRAIA